MAAEEDHVLVLLELFFFRTSPIEFPRPTLRGRRRAAVKMKALIAFLYFFLRS
jgi:hypothetical protein